MNCFVVWLPGERRLRRDYFQPEPSSEVFTIGDLRHAASRVWTCEESELKLCWMKLCSNDNHYTTAISQVGPCGRTITKGNPYSKEEVSIRVNSYISYIYLTDVMSQNYLVQLKIYEVSIDFFSGILKWQ